MRYTHVSMDRVRVLQHICGDRDITDIVTYSFANGSRTKSFMRLFTQYRRTYRTCRIGSVPKEPMMMVVNIWGRGSWVAFLKHSNTDEHAVFRGWSKSQVTHAWQACDGEVLIDCALRKLLRQILDYHYPPEAIGPVTWRSTEDVMAMVDANNVLNSPRTLFGKRPFKCSSKSNPCDEQLNAYLLGMRDVYTTLNTYRRITNGY